MKHIEQAKGYFICKGNTMAINHFIGNLFQCNNGELISSNYVLDGENDCRDTNDKEINNDERLLINNETYSSTCLSLNCTCSPLHFKADNGQCLSYLVEDVEENTIFMPTHRKIFNCSDYVTIDYSFVDDLVPDCGPSADDEPLYKQLLTHENSTNCFLENQIPCTEGHSKCFNISEICIYKFDVHNHLTPCRTGSHLEYCKEFECNIHFKCQGYYCIPWSYVCDGKWDCPFGHDEITSLKCGISRLCTNMFKCKNSQICIHIGDVCDGVSDCPLNDDEFLCQLKEYSCLQNCICLNLAIFCKNFLFTENYFSTVPYISFFVMDTSVKDLGFLKQATYVVSLTFINANLTEICHALINLQYISFLNASLNIIEALHKSCFNDLKKLKYVTFISSKLMNIEEKAFINIQDIGIVDFSHNDLTKLPALIFINVSHVDQLLLSNYPIFHVTFDMFKGLMIKNIITTNPSICCIKPSGSICSAPKCESLLCSELLPKLSVEIVSTVFCILVAFLNFGPGFIKVHSLSKSNNTNKSMSKTYQILITGQCAGNTIYAMKSFILWICNLYYGKKFVIKTFMWQRSIFCLTSYILSLIFHLSVPYFLSLIALARLMIVVYPMTIRFKSPSFVTKTVVCSLMTIISLSIFTTAFNAARNEKVSDNLCSAFIGFNPKNLKLKL